MDPVDAVLVGIGVAGAGALAYAALKPAVAIGSSAYVRPPVAVNPLPTTSRNAGTILLPPPPQQGLPYIAPPPPQSRPVPTPAPPPPQQQATVTWLPIAQSNGYVPTIQTVVAGTRVRLSITTAGLALVLSEHGLAYSANAASADLKSTLTSLWKLASPGSAITVYAPGATLPTDWPPDDPGQSTDFHAQFMLANTTSYTNFPVDVLFWAAT
jgi:hypothetical protein